MAVHFFLQGDLKKVWVILSLDNPKNIKKKITNNPKITLNY